MAYTTIDKPSDYFNTKLYTGDGNSTQAITGVGFQPDFVWQKRRDSSANNEVTDSVRGINSTLRTNLTNAEDTGTDKLQSFDSDGFTVGGSSTQNASGGTYASWNWLASNTTASNTDGSITSSVSANTTSGFSIVSYTGNATAGATVGHGLGVKPDMIITKARAIADNWGVYHKSLGATKGLYLNTTNAEITSSAYYNNTEPTSTLVTLGENEATNDNDTMIMYAFAEKKGFSRFGSYTGNGSTDGTFVYTGFKPSFVLVKRTDTAGYEWSIWDNKRDPFNLADTTLRPNSSASESTIGSFYQIDMLSQGYKFRTSNGDVNGSGGSFIYMAFAENPLVGTNNTPATAR